MFRLDDIAIERFPVAGAFTISRGSRTEAAVIVVRVSGSGHEGRGECVPYARYGESLDGVADAIRAHAADGALTRERLALELPAGAARNALDCALIEIECRLAGHSPAAHLGLSGVTVPRLTCFTLSLGSPQSMADAATGARSMPLLKLKLGGGVEDGERMRAVRAVRPDARIVADANEAWSPDDLVPLLAIARECGVELVEQPLPAGADDALRHVERLVPVCADESCHQAADVADLADRYDAVNVKLDKAGGPTEAVAVARAARAAGLSVMVGCMLSTSLSMAPAWLLAEFADWLDLDGPLLLARDRTPGIVYRDGLMHPPPAGLWG